MARESPLPAPGASRVRCSPGLSAGEPRYLSFTRVDLATTDGFVHSTRERVRFVLHEGRDHTVDEVRLRQV